MENVRMAKSTKSYEERMLEMEKKEQESLEKAKRYAAQKKELDRVGDGFCRRPLTPPDMRFRIRRFS